jgi:hypothetical protein
MSQHFIARAYWLLLLSAMGSLRDRQKLAGEPLKAAFPLTAQIFTLFGCSSIGQ